MIRGSSEIADFILRNYSGKVVEVGVGYAPQVALLLNDQREVIATDRESRKVGGLSIEGDDIFEPNVDLYRGSSLIYSIRPPAEIQTAIGGLAREIGADVLIRPLADEVAEMPGFQMRLVNEGDARFYLFKRVP